ncbi:hypothetical protein THAOC_12583 [Thalassiosira oceanica]|uniref:Uncharacterized protein n=1 Tax=Thalassiosira oceanica TaxID=159749 RepID=K0SJM5_THAOC|nr:hypothetical protein THAOC_12583 [Thalassiosira oceanica]|eukprot:EJK66498.1 hypothetical protein THAOC_12583 [Thalassiosira oceanica]
MIRFASASRGKNGVCLLFRLGVASFQTPKNPAAPPRRNQSTGVDPKPNKLEQQRRRPSDHCSRRKNAALITIK